MADSATVDSTTISAAIENLEVALPDVADSMEQDAEWCVVCVDGEWRQIRFHDYEELFSVPGLYEKVIYDILNCRSPQVVTQLLTGAMATSGENPEMLRVLDLGAGNGMVGELFAVLGAELVVGVDIIEAAAVATQRDRPDIYDSYHVADLTALDDGERRKLAGYRFNCLTCVAALGFGDIPREAFTTAFNLVQPNGWIAFNIKEDFLDDGDESGFAGLIRGMARDGVLDIQSKQRYVHRLGTDRQPIHYVALVGRKCRNL